MPNAPSNPVWGNGESVRIGDLFYRANGANDQPKPIIVRECRSWAGVLASSEGEDGNRGSTTA
jgi:hypothetical protein